jgi:3'-phosphoadenosine 5'-phosphosulfate sulfotransferase (PAPS reductase)/FAD synthetase
MNLHQSDIIIINSSGGKDSLCALYQISEMAKDQNYHVSKIGVSHQDLGRMEWEGTKELAEQQALFFGFNFVVSKRRTKSGVEETLLDYVRRRRKWPSNKQRWCTSDFKRGPGGRVVTSLTKDIKEKHKVLYVFGFRSQESPARAKKQILKFNKNLSTKKREVWEYCPILDWSLDFVWGIIRAYNLPYHFAYDLGMPRLSCVFCIFSPFDALVIAGIHNPKLLDEYISVEDEVGHSFRDGFKILEVREAIERGYLPEKINDWVM